MDRERENADTPRNDEAATDVEDPSGKPPDEGLAYDPSMTDVDEANIPADSDADPEER